MFEPSVAQCICLAAALPAWHLLPHNLASQTADAPVAQVRRWPVWRPCGDIDLEPAELAARLCLKQHAPGLARAQAGFVQQLWGQPAQLPGVRRIHAAVVAAVVVGVSE